MQKYHLAQHKIINFIAKNNLSSGGKLPPEKTLSDMLGVSMITVRRALQELESNNIVERIHGRGTFAKNDLQEIVSNGTILFLSIGKTSETQYSEGYGIVESELFKRGFKTRYMKVAEKPEGSIADSFSDCSGIILFGWINDAWVDFLNPMGLPIVAINDNPCREKIRTVRFDLEKGVRDLVEHLILDKGFKRIAYIGTASSRYENAKQKFKGYSDALKKHGLDLNADSYFKESPDIGEYYKKLDSFFKGTDPFDAIIITGTDIYVNMLNYFYENNSIPRPYVGLVLHTKTYQLEYAPLKKTKILMPEESIYKKTVDVLMNFDELKQSGQNIIIKMKILNNGSERRNM